MELAFTLKTECPARKQEIHLRDLIVSWKPCGIDLERSDRPDLCFVGQINYEKESAVLSTILASLFVACQKNVGVGPGHINRPSHDWK